MQSGIVREEAIRAILALAVPEAEEHDDAEPKALPGWAENVDPDQVLWSITCPSLLSMRHPARGSDITMQQVTIMHAQHDMSAYIAAATTVCKLALL